MHKLKSFLSNSSPPNRRLAMPRDSLEGAVTRRSPTGPSPTAAPGPSPTRRPGPPNKPPAAPGRARGDAGTHEAPLDASESSSATRHQRVPSLSVQKASDRSAEAPQPTSPDHLSPRPPASRPSSIRSARSRERPFQIIEDDPLPRILPEKSECRLRITFDGRDGTPKQSQLTFEKTWTDPASYGELYQQIKQRVDAHKRELVRDRQNVGIEVYQRHGSCLVVGGRHEGPYSVIEDYEAEVLEQKAIQNICGFIYRHPFEPFRLEICLHFSSIRKTPQQSYGRYGRMVIAEINSKMSDNNFMDQEFLPRVHRDQLTSAQIIENILREEPPRKFGSDPRRLSQEIVQRGASTLFIACVHRSMENDLALHLIFGHNYNDTKLPLPGKGTCREPSCDYEVKILLKHLRAFFARTIERDGKRHELEYDEVMPIMNIANEETGAKETKLGEGSYGSVTAVTIDPSHHYLTGDPDRTFALKKFTDQGNFAASFRREFSMLERLFRKQHPHIVTHITSWTQRGIHYILYPQATRNLRTHIDKHQSPGRSGVNVAWLLRQFNGLADGLRSIHEMTEETSGYEHSSTTVDQTNHFVYGYHHDIKPENILLFEHVPGRNPVFKLSDFGAGKFHTMPKSQIHETMISQQSSQLRGTMSYYGPELRRSKTRPFDIWALACVYFEVTIWFALPPGHLEQFHLLREEQSPRTLGWADDYYWRESPVAGAGAGAGGATATAADDAQLRPAVTQYFTLLRDELAKDPDEIGRLLLGSLLDLILECFAINPKERPTADKLCNRLDELQNQAETLAKNYEREVSTPGGSSGHSLQSSDASDHDHDNGNASSNGGDDFFARSPSQRNLTFPEDPPSHRHR